MITLTSDTTDKCKVKGKVKKKNKIKKYLYLSDVEQTDKNTFTTNRNT